MYYLNLNQLTDYDLDNVDEFVRFWSAYYKYSVKEEGSKDLIDYFSELNIGSELTEKNVINLLRWKDPKYLSRRIMSGSNKGKLNHRVINVLSTLDVLNQFRTSEICESEFNEKLLDLFPNGVIWKIFIYHICKPISYPIADQHVFRSYDFHKNSSLPTGWTKYGKYKDYFDEMADALDGGLEKDGDLHRRKDLDSALMVFGQFIKTYAMRGG